VQGDSFQVVLSGGSMRWPYFKTREIRCPDGTTRTVYKNIDDACPLYIAGWNADVSANLQFPGDVGGEAKAKYENKINGFLFALDEQNQSLMMHFRAIYLTYASNPCGSHGFLQRKVEDMIDQQHRISTLRVKIAALIQIVSVNPNDTGAITHTLNEIASRMDGKAVAAAASHEIAEARAIAKDLIQGGQE
jgi:hypothetical protein